MLALAVVLVIGFYFNAGGTFNHWETHRGMLRQISVTGILACGMTLVIITAGIDLAVGSVLALTAVIFAKTSIHMEWHAWAAILAACGVGLATGLVSGGLVAWPKIQPFIATLAMMVFARGLAKWTSGNEKVTTVINTPDGMKMVPAPHIFDVLGQQVFHNNVAVVTLIFFGCLAFTWILLSRLRWGRYMYAIGGNEDAARLSGVPVVTTKLLAYGLCGMFGGIAGICQAVQEMQGDSDAGVGYELTAIAMVVIGGTSLMGGRGGVGLTLIGALTMGYLDKILSINGVGESNRLMLTGVIIVVAVLFQRNRQ
jgi:ribose transport system permease protein